MDQMSGLAEDADVAFVLTTNRPDALEPALAARPGRVDLAIEIPLPDAAARRRLIDLYARGLDLRLADADAVVARTEGVTASFVKELLRKAALVALEDGREHVADADVAAALDELPGRGRRAHPGPARLRGRRAAAAGRRVDGPLPGLGGRRRRDRRLGGRGLAARIGGCATT